ncbi:hypothetical protein Anas_01832 [Armadillidium nasatum]|uniref:Uncharacterized protein n=1 Tax=Armadillidium nasatum TaxID=96803 RepID=A0A5N5T3W7_9CRUS|nr:hypothetical protein Anas_01832 [Armadillidium nasatum]
MSNHKPVTRLIQLSLCTIVDNLDKFMAPYKDRWEEVVDEERPTFGRFDTVESYYLILIIEEIIKREELTYEYLKVLLPEDAESLSCDENTRFSCFGCKTIELISKRCPGFKVLHCHYEFIRLEDGVKRINLMLKESIQRLTLLQKIDFCDTWIKNETIKCIASYCTDLRELNLHRTNINKNEANSLLHESSVVKNSLTKLIIDETCVPTQSVEQCLLSLKNLTYFQSDRTIEATLKLFETVKHLADASDELPKFKTTVCKNKFHRTGVKRLTEDFAKWFVKKFPEELYNKFVSHLIISLKNITQLELSSWDEGHSVSLLLPAIISCKNLITLKLENFMFVDITLLGNSLKKLEKLTLINNIFVRSDDIQFENLKELQVLLFEDSFEGDYYRFHSENMNVPYLLLLSVLSSEKIEKVLFYNQSSFISPLMENLLERGCLRNIKELKVFKCLVGIDCIWQILNQNIPITDIVLGFCNISNDEVKQISNYCKRNNLATSITMVSEIPYYFKWLVPGVEIPYSRKQ